MTTFPEGEFLLPLFPLPNLVFFPRTRLPLHVFEPRYRQMVTDAVSADQRFGIVLLRPGWEADYFGAPPIHACGTVGQIEQAVPSTTGDTTSSCAKCAFASSGEVSREPYRTARVIIQPEQSHEASQTYAQKSWLAELSRQYLHYLPDQVAVPEIETVELEALANALIMSLNIDVQEKQRLLEIDDLIGRAEQIGSELQTRIESLQFLAPYRRKGGDPGQN
jgi:Lon protease-like protein